MFEIDLTREDSDYCDERSASPERQTSSKRRRAASAGAYDPGPEVVSGWMCIVSHIVYTDLQLLRRSMGVD